MNPFFIFVIVLTTAYVIYFAVNIAHDLYGKKEETKKTAEEYDVSDMTDEENDEDDSIAVVESENGFSIGEQQVETSVDAVNNTAEDYGVDSNEVADMNQADGETKESYVERVKAAVSEKMEEPDVYLSDPLYDEELTARLLAGGLSGNNNAPKIECTLYKNEL